MNQKNRKASRWRQADQQSDAAGLRKLLADKSTRDSLACLSQLAVQSSSPYSPGDGYTAASEVFCDGFEVDCGSVSKETASTHKLVLLNAMQHQVPDFILKNVLISSRNSNTYMWITLKPETALISPRTVIRLQKVVRAIKAHAMVYWDYPDVVDSPITLSKVDLAVDLSGAFLSADEADAYRATKNLLREELEALFCVTGTNFLSRLPIPGIRVTKGDNSLNSCCQYAVADAEKTKLLNVKVYDKILDMLGREGTHLVGSRLKNVLGSKYDVDMLDKRVCDSQLVGLTRLEISILKAALVKYEPLAPSAKT